MEIAATGTYGSLFQRYSSAAADARDGAGSQASAAKPPTSGAAVSVELSDQAKAALAASTDTIDISTSLDEIIEKRSSALASKLTKAFQGFGISPDEATLLKIDGNGEIATDSPYKKKIEELFEHDPEAVKELKAIASLNALKAAHEALKIYLEEKKAARNADEEAAAYSRHNSLSLTMHKLADVMTLKDGKLSSAALDYVEAAKPQSMKADKAATDGPPPVAVPKVG